MPKWLGFLRLIFQHNKQNIVRIRYDFGRELVVLLSTGILLGLFYYMFHDFLNDKLSDLPSSLRRLIVDRLVISFVLGLGLWIGSRIQSLYRDEPGWAQFALRSGEAPATVQAFRLGQTLLIIGLSYGIFWKFIAPTFVQWSWREAFILQLISLALAGLFIVLTRKNRDSDPGRNLKPILSDRAETRARTLRSWRWFQMLQRNRLCRLCCGLSLGLLLLIGIMHSLGWPLFLTVLTTMLASALLAWAVAFQLEEDMRALWFERQLGCSHEEFVKVYQEICWMLGLGLALLSLLAALLGGVHRTAPLSEWLKLLPIAALFPVITPSIMFQVAPERPLLQILVTGLIGLFLGTAIYAHYLAALLVPIAITYAKNYQKDNFYKS